MNASLRRLLTHLSNPDLSQQLTTLHDLALYDSGDALLGEDEKEALANTIQLARLLEKIDPGDLSVLMNS